MSALWVHKVLPVRKVRKASKVLKVFLARKAWLVLKVPKVQ